MKAQNHGDGYTMCSNGNFGDPLHGTRKDCYCETSSYVEHKPFHFEAERVDPYYQFKTRMANVKETADGLVFNRGHAWW